MDVQEIGLLMTGGHRWLASFVDDLPNLDAIYWMEFTLSNFNYLSVDGYLFLPFELMHASDDSLV